MGDGTPFLWLKEPQQLPNNQLQWSIDYDIHFGESGYVQFDVRLNHMVTG